MSAAPGRLVLHMPYLLFLGEETNPLKAKTAFGLRDWTAQGCIGQTRLPGGSIDLGLPEMDPAAAAAAGARSLVIGVTPVGGRIPAHWGPLLIAAVEAGLDIVSGLHTPLESVPGLAQAATRSGARLVDVRRPPDNLPRATGRRRSGKRVAMVGTDCALGKKYTALALARAFAERGIDADFRASGQTGIMIAGAGIPMDAVIADFEAGAAEQLSPDAAPDHWDVIEGQGSLSHPAYAAVSLGLLHGSQPDIFVLCHEPGRTELLGMTGFDVPSVDDMIALTVTLGRRTNPAIRCGGLSFNTGAMSADEAERMMTTESARTGLPVADPMRGGPAFDRLVDNCLRGA